MSFLKINLELLKTPTDGTPEQAEKRSVTEGCTSDLESDLESEGQKKKQK